MRNSIATFAVVLMLSACASHQAERSAVAQLQPTKGNSVAGLVRFTQKANTVLVVGEVTGLAPNAVVGFHVHEKGDCSSGDGMSAGGHFNPLGTAHGAHDHTDHHAGDLPSLRADGSGTARFKFETGAISVGVGVVNIVGRGLIVHRDADDYKTQPTGNSGPRVACSVIVMG